MFTFALKVTLEVAAIVLLIIGYMNEDKVIAFERRLWKSLRGEQPARPARAHSATYYASLEEERREQADRARIARNAELARQYAAARKSTNEPRRAA